VQFYYRYVLNVARKESVSPDIERMEIGRLVHSALFSYFEKKVGRSLTEKEIDVDEMTAVVRRTCVGTFGAHPVGAAYLVRRQIIRQMERFLIFYQGPTARRGPVAIRSLERRLETSVGGYRLTGVIDRIETRGDTTCIVDYKTSSSPRRLAIDFDDLDPDVRESWSEAIGSIQLPFYLLLYQAQTPAPIEALDAFFLLLGRTHMDGRMEAPLFKKSGQAAADYEKAKEVIFGLLKEITDPDMPFSPEYRAKNSCLFCDYRHLCGV
jgi:hypothetical protein